MPAKTVPWPTSSLARFLLGDATSEPTLEALKATGLVGHAFTRLPQHPQRAQLRAGFVHIAAHHVTARRAVAEMLRAWNAIGLIPFVFKGFHLAEFVYPAPGHRGYADIDILVAEKDVAAACRVAEDAGWEVTWHAGQHDDLHALHGPEYLGHEAAHLHHTTLGLQIDLHRRIVHNVHNLLPPEPATWRLTEAALAAAEVVAWEGAQLRMPQPVDAVVFGLALNRCWGSDGWRVKPRDYADLEALVQCGGVDRAAILVRAAELGVLHTVRVFLCRCDPPRQRLDLRPPFWWARRQWELGTWRERGPVDLVRAWMAMREAARDAVALAHVLPLVADTRRRLRRSGDAAARGPATRRKCPNGRVGSLAWRTLRRALHRSMRLLRVDATERPRLATLAAHRLLRSRGVAVELEADPSGEAPTLILDGRPVAVIATLAATTAT